jgi:hypothetical protein
MSELSIKISVGRLNMLKTIFKMSRNTMVDESLELLWILLFNLRLLLESKGFLNKTTTLSLITVLVEESLGRTVSDNSCLV